MIDLHLDIYGWIYMDVTRSLFYHDSILSVPQYKVPSKQSQWEVIKPLPTAMADCHTRG